ncbi:M28 family peptidase [Hyphobacterium marinum]|uniref:M28 family peptidase n=1 Tax=Hyphobacterium marinum TaxID=3116574 RepID=A0ABU7M0C5_9PROT|nr:M28 family peptidase [Hyphobacterium sp. Y6023]MEE2566860.1 M28 family peptidase [Hyphobacterium sp. Y6023]
MKAIYAALAAAGLGLSACSQGNEAATTMDTASANSATVQTGSAGTGLPDISAGNIEAHIRFLAHDLMGGRDAGSEEFLLAANYVATQFRLMGLEPGGDDNGYFAMAPFQRVSVDADASSLTVGEGADAVSYTHGEDVFISANPALDDGTATGEVVFVGYGLTLPHHDYDDYAGIDVTGRIVVVMSGAPDIMASDERSHQQRSSTKRATAAAHGAIGMITISSMGAEQFASTYGNYVGRSSVELAPEAAEEAYRQLVASATISADVAAEIFADAPMSLDEAVAAMENGPSSFATGTSVSITQRSVRELYEEPNVVGILPGTDPELADEYVILTAHLDHIGTFPEEQTGVISGCRVSGPEDHICNGAVDNASGVSVMLETARTFMEEGAPRRSVVFVALAAEEKGLLGSEYFSTNPTVPHDAMVANVNLDMPVIVYEFSDVIAFGAERSELGPIATRAAARLGVTISDDPIPQQNLFVRSDHYNFVRQGVPSLFLMTGFSSPNPAWDEGEGFMGFLNTHYHRASDQLDLDLLYDQAAKFANINYIIAREIADADEALTWNEGDFFGEYFGSGD